MEIEAGTSEDQLLRRAVDTFAKTTGIRMNIIAFEYPIGGSRFLDALVDIPVANETQTYAIEIKRHLTMAKLGLAAKQLRDAPYKGMLVTDYVNPNMAERLKDMDLAFIDLAGNAYLNETPIYVYIKGNHPPERKELGFTKKPIRAVQAAGLKILFGILTKPKLLLQPYRDIAKATDVALGTVGWVMTDLRDHGYLYEGKGRKRQLIRRRQILEQWVAAYPEKLRPKLILGRYKAPQHRWWEEMNIEQHHAQWGGEIAAERLTDYLKPETATIYADRIPPRLLAERQLTRDTQGDIEILRRFWNPQLFQLATDWPNTPKDIVPPLLVYADLMATGDDRNIETAAVIYEKFLHGSFEQD